MSDYYPAHPFLTRNRDDELIRWVNTASFGALIVAAESTDLRWLRKVAEACRATADRFAKYPAELTNSVQPLAVALLREIAARADHNANHQTRTGRQVELRVVEYTAVKP